MKVNQSSENSWMCYIILMQLTGQTSQTWRTESNPRLYKFILLYVGWDSWWTQQRCNTISWPFDLMGKEKLTFVSIKYLDENYDV